ncbi:nucleotidyltransferase domain-containing protein [Planctomicrobium sp. SH668]|uniref:nucleotidyltransferase domain-containing protein n=1 Tax=Planctomicrobium sp. SH668 TaxID=3448126 RepID=UPI003F5B6BBB
MLKQKLTTPELFTSAIHGLLKERLKSVVLFGSGATGDFVQGTSDFDLLVVLDRVTPAELRTLGPAIKNWTSHGNPLPLIFSEHQIQNSVDTFAAEFIEIQNGHRVLFGTDPVVGMEIHLEHVRIHLERELKGKLLALRNHYALAFGHRQKVADLMTESFSTFLSLFRIALRIYQPIVPRGKMCALRVLATYIPFSLSPFETIDALRWGGIRLKEIDVDPLFEEYIRAVELIVDKVDTVLHPQS